MAIENLPQICARIVAARRAAGDDAPAFRERTDRTGPRRRARMLKHNINAALLGQTPHLARPIRVRVVDDFIRTERTRLRKFLIRACSCDYTRAAQLRDLYAD